MKDKSGKDTAYYMGLPYTFVLRRDEVGDVIARIEELPGCIAHGSDDTEALARVKEVQRLWIEDCLEAGDAVPEPQREEDLPSGKWVQRVPRTLHQRLVTLAKKEEISLNQLVTSMLSEAVGTKTSRTIDRALTSDSALARLSRR
jgi:antitoxin HicB